MLVIVIASCFYFFSVSSAPPLSVVAVASSPHSVFLSWDPPSTLQRNGIITGYQVRVIVAESGRQFEHTVETTYYNVTTSITPYTTYNLAVAARTVNGTGPFSNMTTVRTLEDGKKHYCYCAIKNLSGCVKHIDTHEIHTLELVVKRS